MTRKKYLSNKDRQESVQKQRQRIKIANTVKRYNISNNCCICGEPGIILHNPINPYIITFICRKCRRLPLNKQKAKKYTIDITTYIKDRIESNTKNQRINKIPIEVKERIVEGYIQFQGTLGQYCIQQGISRYQLNQMIKQYDTKYPETNIIQQINKNVRNQQGISISQSKRKYS